MPSTNPPIDRSSMDEDTPVSEDFYQHVNGNWLATNPVPEDYPAWGGFIEVQHRNEELLHRILEETASAPGPDGSPSQMVGDYFAAGMDSQAIAESATTELTPLLDAIESVETTEELRDRMKTLKRLGVGAFHKVGVSPDFEDSNRYLVYVGQGGLGLPEKDYYLRDDERSTALMAAYLDHVTAQLSNLGAGDRREAEEIVAFEKRLAESSYPAEKLRDVRVTLNRHDVDSLDELMPNLGLTGYLKDLGVTSPTVNVDNAGFLGDLDAILEETPMETIHAYLRWHLIRAFATALPEQFEEEAFDFYGRKLGGQQKQKERWKRVLAAASSDIGEQVARLYVEAAFSPEAKERCEEMVDHLIAAMQRSIEANDWMTEDTRDAALTKVGRFTYKIGYPDEWRDYSGLEIVRDSYLRNRMKSVTFEFERQFGRLDESVDKKEWAMPAHVVNAYYNPLLNEIVFPAGILQPPFFYADADDAVNYGGIGSVIGHEITHGFDDNGSQFDEMGRRRNWWTDEDRTEFERRAKVLVDQFSEYEVADDQNVNGQLTLGENIADLGGVSIAYDAFLHASDDEDETIDGFTPQERFFLSYATIWRTNYTDEYLRLLANIDVHSPSRFRVNGPLSNFQPFAEVFQIDEGTPMKRDAADLVEIW